MAEIGQLNVTHLWWHLYALIIVMLTTPHAAGEAPFPWHIPCVLYLMSPLAKSVESSNEVQRKNFISFIACNMALTDDAGTPDAWNTRLAIAWQIRSKQFEASTDAVAAGYWNCQDIS